MITTRRIDQNMKWHPAGAARRLDLRLSVAGMFGGKLGGISAGLDQTVGRNTVIVESRFSRQ